MMTNNDISDPKQQATNCEQAEKMRQMAQHSFECAGNAMFWIRPDATFCYVNQTACRMMGYTAAELRSLSIFDLDPDFPPPAWPEHWEELKQQRSLLFEAGLRAKDGRIYPVELFLSYIEFDGEAYNFAQVIDISDRKAAEKKLRQNEQKYQKILDAITDMVLVKGPQSRIVWANKAFREYYAMTNEELKNMIDASFNEPDYTQQYIRDDAYVFETGKSLEIEEPVTRYDGKVLLFNTIKSVIRNEADENILTVGVSRDVSDRKAAEAALSEYANCQTLLNQLANQIRNSLDLDTAIATTIRSIRDLIDLDFCAFFWYNSDLEIPTWSLVQEAKLEDIPSGIGSYSSVLMGPIEQFIFQQKILRIDDAEQYEEPIHREFMQAFGVKSELLLPICTKSGRFGYIVCAQHRRVRSWKDSEIELLKAVSDQLAIAIDQAELYTESRAKSQELQQTLQELHSTQMQMLQSEKMSSLGQLVAGIAHEINNPVNFIHGNLAHVKQYTQDLLNVVNLAQQSGDREKITAALAAIDLEFIQADLPKVLRSMSVGTERIAEIVSSLRTFSRMDEADFKKVDIHASIDSTLLILQHRLKEMREHPAINIIKSYSELPEVECYAGLLNQVFMNILTNAIDAIESKNIQQSVEKRTANPNQITIRTLVVDRDWVEIAISDNGTGMTEEVQQKMFNPFFTTKAVGKGTGMGMSISYQIIAEKHRGQLKCISTVDRGTEFVIQIPIRQS